VRRLPVVLFVRSSRTFPEMSRVTRDRARRVGGPATLLVGLVRDWATAFRRAAEMNRREDRRRPKANDGSPTAARTRSRHRPGCRWRWRFRMDFRGGRKSCSGRIRKVRVGTVVSRIAVPYRQRRRPRLLLALLARNVAVSDLRRRGRSPQATVQQSSNGRGSDTFLFPAPGD